MVARELHKLIKKKPFVPLRIHISDGRTVLIRHPDQVLVSPQHVFVGLARSEEKPPLETPSKDTLHEDFLWISVLHVASAEPARDSDNGRGKKKPGKKKD
jgi:hypothetical protein